MFIVRTSRIRSNASKNLLARDFLRTAQPYILLEPFAIARLEEAVQGLLAEQPGAQT